MKNGVGILQAATALRKTPFCNPLRPPIQRLVVTSRLSLALLPGLSHHQGITPHALRPNGPGQMDPIFQVIRTQTGQGEAQTVVIVSQYTEGLACGGIKLVATMNVNLKVFLGTSVSAVVQVSVATAQTLHTLAFQDAVLLHVPQAGQESFVKSRTNAPIRPYQFVTSGTVLNSANAWA